MRVDTVCTIRAPTQTFVAASKPTMRAGRTTGGSRQASAEPLQVGLGRCCRGIRAAMDGLSKASDDQADAGACNTAIRQFVSGRKL
ncbi:hypothetical protein G3N57_18715 [Paraburkholderia sp. Se-20369]|nr:hypothetical protein [Paraburkholderia sp. Se-20369]